MMFFRISMQVALGLMIYGLVACGQSNSPSSQAQSGTQAIQIRTAPAAEVAWDRTVEIVGTLYPKDEATLAAEVEGTVEKTMVEFGDRIKAGQTLALIDSLTYKAQLEQSLGAKARAEANLANAKAAFERVKGLSRSGAVAQREMDEATAQLSQWEAEVKAASGAEAVARLALTHVEIKAPFDGAIANRIVTKGDFVKSGTPMFKVVNDTVLKFIFAVPEKYGSLVQKKLPVSFSVDNYPGETFTGGVYLISPVVTPESRMFNVGALVPNPDLKLKASSFARGSLVLEKGVPSVAVPIEAIVSFAGVTKVFVIEGEIARSREVKVGRIQPGQQEVVSGLKMGEIIAITGLRVLTEGAKVSILPPLETTAVTSTVVAGKE